MDQVKCVEDSLWNNMKQKFEAIWSIKGLSIREYIVPCNIILTQYTPKLPSYENQSIDLFWKSTDWFLYIGNFGV